MKSNTKKVSIQSRRRLFFLRPICIFAVLFLIITIATNYYKLYQLNNEKNDKEKEYIELQEKSEYLRNEITKLHNPEEIAKFARENYSYSKDGELIVKIEEKKEEEKKVEDKVSQKSNNKKLYIIIVGGLLIISAVSALIKRKDSE